jgi:intracellular multiplication protein IcmV
MGILKTTKKVSGHIFNFKVSQWLDLDALKGFTNYFLQQFKLLYQIEQATQTETFEEAIDRFELTPKDLQIKYSQYSFLIFFFSGISLLLLSYTFFLAHKENWMGTVMSAALTLYAWSLVFRYHFWRYQVKRQKLGCTLSEWLGDLFRKDRM